MIFLLILVAVLSFFAGWVAATAYQDRFERKLRP